MRQLSFSADSLDKFHWPESLYIIWFALVLVPLLQAHTSYSHTCANFSSVFAMIASNDSRWVKTFLLWTFRWNVFANIGSDTWQKCRQNKCKILINYFFFHQSKIVREDYFFFSLFFLVLIFLLLVSIRLVWWICLCFYFYFYFHFYCSNGICWLTIDASKNMSWFFFQPLSFQHVQYDFMYSMICMENRIIST